MNAAEFRVLDIPIERFETRLVAPCGADYVHLVGVDVLQGDHVTEVRGSGTTRHHAQNCGRGSVIVSRFCCENGHVFDIALSFHKGQTFISRSECFPADETPATLWRD